MLTPEHFYSILRDFVVFYPKKEYSCQRPNTFLVVPEYSTLISPNLGIRQYDKDKVYFWSRSWELSQYNQNTVDWEYPLMIVWEMSGVWENLLQNREIDKEYTFEIGVLDTFQEECDNKFDYCSQRTKYEIFKDTERILTDLFLYLRKVKCYTVDGATRYLHEDAPAILLNEGRIDMYELDRPNTVAFENDMRNAFRNTQNKVARFDGQDGQGIYGTLIKATIIFSEDCTVSEFNFDFTRYEKVFNNCC